MTEIKNKFVNDTLDSNNLNKVLNYSLNIHEKLPMLEVIFEKFVHLTSIALYSITNEYVNIQIADLSFSKFGKVTAAIKDRPCSCLFDIPEWKHSGLLILDRKLIFDLIDLLLGGKKNTALNSNNPSYQQYFSEDKPHTMIGQSMIRRVAEVILQKLGDVFDTVSRVKFVFNKIEQSIYFSSICLPEDQVLNLKLSIEVKGQTNFLHILIPYEAIKPIRSKLKRVLVGSNSEQYISWQQSLIESIKKVNVKLTAKIRAKNYTLGEIMSFKVDDVILTDYDEDQDIDLVDSNENVLLQGQVGKIKSKVAFHVNKIIKQDHDNT